MSTSYTPGTIVEIDISNSGWGGDFSLQSNGDWVLAVDTQAAPTATNERLVRLILTNPNLKDQFGNPIGYADDIYHTTWGAGLKAYVSDNFTAQTLQNLGNSIKQQLIADPGVSPTVTPSVQISLNGTSAAVVQVQYVDIFGQPQTTPTINLSSLGTVSVGSGGL